MKYYDLREGDYLQQGDEYWSPSKHKWVNVERPYFGKKYGYEPLDQTTKCTWGRIRRLVPDNFVVDDRLTNYVDDQYGFEFEI